MDIRHFTRILTATVFTNLAVLSTAASGATLLDPWITTKVKMALLTADEVDGLAVSVDTRDGRVTLHGSVESVQAKLEAGELTRETEGVRDVRNLLVVVEKSQQEEVEVSDAALKRQIETVLQRDQALDDSEIEVKSVNQGVVLLAGTARNLSDHRRALQDARSVQGVQHVASEIEGPDALTEAEMWREGKTEEGGEATASWSASDMWITMASKVRLMTNGDVPALDINVDTRDGVVTLFGIVDSTIARQLAEAEVRKVDGVRRVQNDLQVVPEEKQERVKACDDDIQEQIESKLTGEEDLEGADIDVEVQNGVARLKGTVPSQASRLQALTLARATNGVRAIQDDVRMKHDERSLSGILDF